MWYYNISGESDFQIHKLLKIHKELNRQNGIIFDAKKEHNELELECDNLKGFAKLRYRYVKDMRDTDYVKSIAQKWDGYISVSEKIL